MRGTLPCHVIIYARYTTMSCYYICAVHYHVISTQGNPYQFKSSVATPVMKSDGKLIQFGVIPVNLECKSTSDENVLGTYKLMRNDDIV